MMLSIVVHGDLLNCNIWDYCQINTSFLTFFVPIIFIITFIGVYIIKLNFYNSLILLFKAQRLKIFIDIKWNVSILLLKSHRISSMSLTKNIFFILRESSFKCNCSIYFLFVSLWKNAMQKSRSHLNECSYVVKFFFARRRPLKDFTIFTWYTFNMHFLWHYTHWRNVEAKRKFQYKHLFNIFKFKY